MYKWNARNKPINKKKKKTENERINIKKELDVSIQSFSCLTTNEMKNIFEFPQKNFCYYSYNFFHFSYHLLHNKPILLLQTLSLLWVINFGIFNSFRIVESLWIKKEKQIKQLRRHLTLNLNNSPSSSGTPPVICLLKLVELLFYSLFI